jgi:hypothetical protein
MACDATVRGAALAIVTAAARTKRRAVMFAEPCLRMA